ncbi:exported hypothetical protein [uncultured Eubacteriales bacterium]|uniref:Uncharacterized protein n=1 Tax=uncultured Eubacteriales bacterium TaxID=172733 RepID=A0A212KA44_9FIRM|nr:exported hypothetical protein [uncultured Eubacteriales bacterium]
MHERTHAISIFTGVLLCSIGLSFSSNKSVAFFCFIRLIPYKIATIQTKSIIFCLLIRKL